MFFKRTAITADQVTEDLIEKWGRKYPEGVFEITIGDKRAFVRMSTNREIKEFPSMVMSMEVPEAILDRLKKAWLGGDDELISNEAYHNELFIRWGEIVKEKVNKLISPKWGITF